MSKREYRHSGCLFELHTKQRQDGWSKWCEQPKTSTLGAL